MSTDAAPRPRAVDSFDSTGLRALARARTTPYFPALFEEIHQIIAMTPSDVLMTPEWLAAKLHARRPQGEQQNLL